MLLAISSALLVVAVCYWYYKWNYFKKKLHGVTWDKMLPFIGHALEFRNSEAFLKTPSEMCRRHNGIAPVMIGYSMYVFVTDYKLIEYLMTSNQHVMKSKSYYSLTEWLGSGLLLSYGEKWKRRRKMITPSYHFQILEQFILVFNANGDILVRILAEREDGNESTDIYPYMSACALDIICETAMGTKVNAQVDSKSEYVQSVKSICKIIMDRMFHPLLQYDAFYHLSNMYREERKALKVLHEYTLRVIKQRKEALKTTATQQVQDDDGSKKRMAFLDLLLQSTSDGLPLSDEDVREEVDTFMFEGHDTTSSGMSFALYCIASHPLVQEKLLQEQRNIFGDEKNVSPTHKNLQDMKYMEMVIKETLRLYPSVPMIGRQITEDFTFGDITFRQGTQLILSIYGLHRDECHFKDPLVFDPERFAVGNRSSFSYLPFSAGARNCIGQKFAILEMKSTLSNVLRNFELSPVVPAHKPRLLAETILKSSNGLCIRLKKRK